MHTRQPAGCNAAAVLVHLRRGFSVAVAAWPFAASATVVASTGAAVFALRAAGQKKGQVVHMWLYVKRQTSRRSNQEMEFNGENKCDQQSFENLEEN